MIRGQALRQLVENNGQRNPAALVRHVYEGLGLADANGRRHLTPSGNPDWQKVLEARQKGGYLPGEFSLLEVAQVLCGENWARKMQGGGMQAALLESQGVNLLEAGTGAITPGDFIDVNALTAVVTGLYEVSILEGFNKLELDFVSKLAPDDPTKVFGGKKVIGAGGFGNKSEIRKPGMPTHRSGLTERWINTPETQEHADSYEILFETLYLDQTGDVTTKGNDIGYWLRYAQAIQVIDCFIGVTTATQFNYKGSTFSTYLTASTYDNDLSNELVHENNVENVLIKFRDMKDPETGTRVTINPNLVVVNREKRRTADAIFGPNAQSVQYRDSGSAPLINVSNPAYKGQFSEIIESPLIYERCVAADGLALSASNAGKYWWMVDSTGGGHLRWSTNWPLRVQQATPTQMDMIDRGVAMFVKAAAKVAMSAEPQPVA